MDKISMVSVEGGIWWRAPGEVRVDDLAKGLAWAEPGVRSGAIPNDFAMDAILLVSKLEVPHGDEAYLACAMQRGGDSGVNVASEGDLGMAE
jgi:hypothetical protein